MANKSTTSSKTTVQPLFDNVLIQPLEAEQTTPSEIILPDSAKERPQMGKIMAVGKGAWNEDGDKLVPLTVKTGQKVMYKKWGGNEIKVNGEEWMLVAEKDILAIID